MRESEWKFSMLHPETGEELILLGRDWKAVLSLEAYGDMILAAQECPVEVGGRHRVVIDREKKCFYILQIWIPRQVCSGGHFNPKRVSEHEALLETERQGLNWNEFRLGIWHSHGHMNAVFSGTDLVSIEYEMEGFHREWMRQGCPWWDNAIQVDFVVNKSGEISARFSSSVPCVSGIPILIELEDGVSKLDVQDYMEKNRRRIREIVFERVEVYVRPSLFEEDENSDRGSEQPKQVRLQEYFDVYQPRIEECRSGKKKHWKN